MEPSANDKNKKFINLFLTTGSSSVKDRSKIKIELSTTIKTLRNILCEILRKEHVFGPKIYLNDIFMTKDPEGKIAIGKNSDKVEDRLKEKDIIYIRYYLAEGVWTPYNYPELIKHGRCSICLKENNIVNKLRNGWTTSQICNNCLENMPITAKDKEGKIFIRESNHKIYCAKCGRKHYINSQNIIGYHGLCKTCLSPKERQCSNCDIPIEFVNSCNKCSKRYCSQKCQTESGHNDKCK